MKRKCGKRNTRGSGKAIKYEVDHDYKPTSPTRNVAVKSKRLTRSNAATIHVYEALISNKCTITTVATSVSPKVPCARSPVVTNDEVSTDKGKQLAEEFTDENASHGNQDSYQSTNLSTRYPTKSQHGSLVAFEHAESQARNPALSSSTELDEKHLSAIVLREQDEGREIIHFLEMAPMMDHCPLDDAEQQRPRNPPISCSTGLLQNISPSTVVKEINENDVPEAQSIHMTEMAAMTDNIQMDDDEEAESIDQTKICVEGYLVRMEIAPLLQEIMDKHKDIADGCKLEKRKGRVPFLEMICDTCQKIRDKSFSDFDPSELKDMMTTVEVILNAGFNVKWLLERLEVILEAKCLGKKCRAFKRKYIEVDLLQEKINILTEQLSATKAEFETKKFEVDGDLPNLNNQLEDLRLKGFRQWGKSLLYGLI